MNEEDKIFAGDLFSPAAAELKAIKLNTHNLCTSFNATFEDEEEKRAGMINEIFKEVGEGTFLQGPIYIHYGTHTTIGNNVFANFNLIIQDDALVTIGNDCDFGPNVTIVTPIHPMLPNERKALFDKNKQPKRLCYAKPVNIGDNCWIAANVTICPGVTIGDNCVIGAGSIVIKDIPANSFAAGNPCRVIRELTDQDSLKYKPELLGDYTISDQ